MVEEVAHGPPAMFSGERPHFRTDGVGENERADRGASDPPPCVETVDVPEAGRANRRASPDVCRQQRRRDQPWAERSAGDEEVVGLLDSAGCPESDTDEERAVPYQQGQ